jgi:glycosyltransferase involved in cell wall biosynthesis
MSLKLFSHVNADSDLIEAWLQYYLQLGIDAFHLIVHGPARENERLLELASSFPIIIEDMYEGPFDSDQKKSRLDVLLAQNSGQWVLLVDTDEFVEFPYEDIPETVKMLELANANLMPAPMLQRMTEDGSLDTPAVIENPFKLFPRCSTTLYRDMGMKGDVFKFPLFYCSRDTRLWEEGNHHPPLGCEPRAAGILGVTHHFKFRRTVSQRLERMIRSEHPWRHESVQLHTYLESHSNRVPLDGTFVYSREELFRRRLLRRLPDTAPPKSRTDTPVNNTGEAISCARGRVPELRPGNAELITASRPKGKTVMFVLPKSTELGGLESYFISLFESLKAEGQRIVILCLDHEPVSVFTGPELSSRAIVKCVPEPKSFVGWFRLIREARPDIAVFCYRRLTTFPWQAPVASSIAGVQRRIAIQDLVPLPPPLPVEGKVHMKRLRRLVGHRARYMLKTKLAARIFHKTICAANVIRCFLVRDHGFLEQKTITIHNGVSTSIFDPNEPTRAATRARFDIGDDDFLLICATTIAEEKGVDVLIQAVSRVLRQGISCKCIILGDGPLEAKFRMESNSLGLMGHVFFVGLQRNIRPYLHAGSAFILTSRCEAGLPQSLLEAMACGLPCIVTDVGGNVEAVKNQVTGLVISPDSVDEAEEAIAYLATHPDNCAEMGVRAYETARGAFEIGNSLNELKAAILG